MEKLWEILASRSEENCQIISQMSLLSTVLFSVWSKGLRGERKRSVCHHSANEGWSLFLSHYWNARSVFSPATERFAFTYSQIEEPFTSKAIQVSNKGCNYKAGVTIVCSAVTCLCILGSIAIMLKHKSCNYEWHLHNMSETKQKDSVHRISNRYFSWLETLLRCFTVSYSTQHSIM